MSDVTVPEGTSPADVDLTGIDGNAMVIIGTVRRGLREAGNLPEVVKSFTDQAMGGDYDHLLRCAIAFTTEAGQ
jgi:hypothetical protein